MKTTIIIDDDHDGHADHDFHCYHHYHHHHANRHIIGTQTNRFVLCKVVNRDIMQLYSGWWFGCHEFYFPIFPIDELIFVRGVAQAPTSITSDILCL